MTHKRCKAVKITMFIGLLGELLTIGYLLIALISNTLTIALGDLDREAAIFPTLLSMGIFLFLLIFLIFFVIHIKHYRTYFAQDASFDNSSKVFKSYVVYGVVVFFLFFPSAVQGSVYLTFVTNLPALTIGTPYTIIGTLGLTLLN